MFPRRTLITLFLFTLLAAAVLYWLNRSTGPAVTVGSSGTRRVFPQNLDTTAAIIIERGDDTISLRRQNGGWEILEPIAAPADSQRIRRLLDALEALPLIDHISKHSLGQRRLSLERLGLSPPQARLALSFQNRPAVTLDIGHASPSGNALYLFHSGAPEKILVTDAAFLYQLPDSFAEFRQRLLIPTPSPLITALEIRRPSQPTLRIIRKDNLWHLVQPLAGRASQSAVAELTQALTALTIENIIWPETLADPATAPQPPSFAAYGLDPESALSLLIWEQSPTPLRLRFGQPVLSNPGLLYALSADQATLVTVTNAVLSLLDLSPADLRDKRLFREDPSLLASLSIRYPGQTLELESDDDQLWHLSAPIRSRASQHNVRAFINTLLTLRAEKILVTDEPAAEALFSRQITFNFNDLPPAVLAFEYTPFLSQFTFTNDSSVTYLISSTNLPPELISLDEATLLADPLIINTPPDAIRRLTFASPFMTQAFERVNAQWQSTDPESPLLPHLPQWLDDLSCLRADRVAQLTPLLPIQLTSLDLSPPALEITLDLSGSDALRRVLSIGAPASPGTRYVTLRGNDILYIVPTNSLPMLLLSQ